MGIRRRGVGFLEEGREYRLPGLLYANDLALCGESDEDLMTMVGWFVEVCMERGLKVSADKSKVIVLNGEEGLECEIYVDGIRLEYVSEFNYFECVLEESECSRKMASGRRVSGTIRSLVKARDLHLECVKVLHEKLLVPCSYICQ